MVQRQSLPPTKKSISESSQDELKKRLVELDDAYHKQLRTLIMLVRASRINIHKPRRS